jgi:hypothetical protein
MKDPEAADDQPNIQAQRRETGVKFFTGHAGAEVPEELLIGGVRI